MAIVNATISNGTTPPEIFTATSNVAVTTMYLCNKSSGAVTCNVFLSPSGSVDYGNSVIYSLLTIQANDTYVLENERLLLDIGDAIRANVESSADNNKIVTTVSYTNI